MQFSRLLVCGVMLTGLLQGQSEKVMIQELQRDVAQFADKLRQFKEGQDQKNAELEALLKQTLDSNAKLVANLGSLQQSLTAAVADQQGKLVQPINAVGSKVDQLSQSFGALQTSMDEIIRRMARNDEKLTEILSNVKTLNTPPAAPPPSASGPGGGTSPVAGSSADVAFQAAQRDLSGGRNGLAMDEFADFLKKFPMSENAPKALYYIGVIYDRDQDYENAVKAYDRILEQYPENPATRDASYGKAVALMKLERNVEAKKEFAAFLKKYPTDDNAAQAKQHLKELDGPSRPPASKQKGRR